MLATDRQHKEELKKDIDSGKYAIKSKSFEEHEAALSYKNIGIMSSKALIMQLDSKRVPEAFKILCKAELDKRLAIREAKAKKTE